MPIGVRKGNTVHMDVQQSGPSSRGVTTEEARQHLGEPLPQSADAIDRVVRLAPRWLVVSNGCGRRSAIFTRSRAPTRSSAKGWC